MRRTGKTCLMIREMQRLVAAGVDETAILFVSFEDDRSTPSTRAGLRPSWTPSTPCIHRTTAGCVTCFSTRFSA
jgi:hypothetical protein